MCLVVQGSALNAPRLPENPGEVDRFLCHLDRGLELWSSTRGCKLCGSDLIGVAVEQWEEHGIGRQIQARPQCTQIPNA